MPGVRFVLCSRELSARPERTIIEQIERTPLGDDQPAIYFRRGFHALPAAS
jgi:hypothetical protein